VSESDAPSSSPADPVAVGDTPAEADKGDGAQSWRNLLELDSQLFIHRGIRLLTPEARVLINLKLNGTMNVTAAMELAGVSYRGFYAVLERLKQAGLVDQVKDLDDQRVRNLQLDPSTPIPASGL
jgi:DNA-binding MarR family transcriptional regulator